ncbi:MAG: phage terminase large subunit, partial [Armatimonadia bacterium]|nr:phage terminase large subunit [Armatimonadia bacterium]
MSSPAVKEFTPAEAAAEILRRKRCQQSLASFALNVDIPGAPDEALEPDEDLVGPASELLASHHALLCEALQETMNTPFGRLMVFMPPGAAKSSYCNVGMAWDMSRPPPPFRKGDTRLIHLSYNDTIVRKQSRRVKSICSSSQYANLWDEPVHIVADAANEWSLSNGSEYMAAGIMAGVTGNRADGILIDDPVKNREDADSEQIRQKTIDEYQDSVMSRLKPGAYVIIVQTRWHEQDLAGSILPEDYDGRTGWVLCRDNMWWYIINIPAKAERADDPLHRQVGEYLWPEWFPPQHWAQYESDDTREGRRRWASLYQQRPTPEGSGDFDRNDFNWYNPGEEPMNLHLIGASDYAVTEDGGDFSEHGVAGLDGDNQLWLVDWWSGQTTTEKTIEAFLDLVEKHKRAGQLRLWANEGGVIDKAVRPAINRRMRERNTFVEVRSLPSMKDKVAKVSSFASRVSAGSVWLPRLGWAYDLVDQLVALPAGRYDDKADVAGLLGRMIDKFIESGPPPEKKPRGIKPFSA